MLLFSDVISFITHSSQFQQQLKAHHFISFNFISLCVYLLIVPTELTPRLELWSDRSFMLSIIHFVSFLSCTLHPRPINPHTLLLFDEFYRLSVGIIWQEFFDLFCQLRDAYQIFLMWQFSFHTISHFISFFLFATCHNEDILYCMGSHDAANEIKTYIF